MSSVVQSDLLYSKADHVRVEDLFSVHVKFMKAVAQIPINFDRYLPTWIGGVGRILTISYCIFILAHSAHMALLYSKTTYDMMAIGELELLADALTMAIIYAFATFSTLYFLYLSSELQNSLKRINQMYHHHSLVGLTYVSSYRSFRLSRLLGICWPCACMGGASLWVFSPILLGTHTLPLNPWYPIDPLDPTWYTGVYVTQFLCQFFMGIIFGNCSAMFASIAVIILGQLDVLFCSLKNLDFHARLMSGEDIETLMDIQSQLPMGDDDELNQYVLSEEHKIDEEVLREVRADMKGVYKTRKQALHDGLVHCVHLHRFIFESCCMLEDFFNSYCLVKSMQITMQLCLLVFRGVTGERSAMRMINFVQYCVLTFIELFILTFCGELLRSHSVRSGEAFWRSQWFTSSSEIRKEVLIFLVNSRRGAIVTAGKFYPMDVQRLRSVVTQAFSFYTLLRKMQERREK